MVSLHSSISPQYNPDPADSLTTFINQSAVQARPCRQSHCIHQSFRSTTPTPQTVSLHSSISPQYNLDPADSLPAFINQPAVQPAPQTVSLHSSISLAIPSCPDIPFSRYPVVSISRRSDSPPPFSYPAVQSPRYLASPLSRLPVIPISPSRYPPCSLSLYPATLLPPLFAPSISRRPAILAALLTARMICVSLEIESPLSSAVFCLAESAVEAAETHKEHSVKKLKLQFPYSCCVRNYCSTIRFNHDIVNATGLHKFKTSLGIYVFLLLCYPEF